MNWSLLLNWATVAEHMIPSGTFVLAALGMLGRVAGHGRRAAKREHDVFRRLREADLKKDDRVHNGRLYADLTGQRFVSPEEIRYVADLEPIQNALVFYSSARSQLKPIPPKEGGPKLVLDNRVFWWFEVGSAWLLGGLAACLLFAPFVLDLAYSLSKQQALFVLAFFYPTAIGVLIIARPFMRTAFAVRCVLKLQEAAWAKAAASQTAAASVPAALPEPLLPATPMEPTMTTTQEFEPVSVDRSVATAASELHPDGASANGLGGVGVAADATQRPQGSVSP